MIEILFAERAVVSAAEQEGLGQEYPHARHMPIGDGGRNPFMVAV
jgi:hypothetical protein